MALLRLCLYLTLAASLATAAQILPVRDLKPGMKGIGKTVFSGDRVEEFDVEILGVLENAGPKQSIILARLSGGPIAQTGVMQGMSGSPVYIEGKLVGAVAMAFAFSKEPIAGIRPIEEMLASRPGMPQPPRPRVALGDKSLTARLERPEPPGNRLVDIATPVTFSGFTAGAIERFAPELRALGLEPQQAFSGGAARTVSKPKDLEPGSMISVQLMTGDLNMGADGTVTHIDGNRIWAFGHKFLSAGPTELPFARASVMALLPSLSTSFKISSSGDPLGAITSDYSTAVAGELGRRPRMIPMTISLRSGTQSSKYSMELASDSFLSPMLVQMALYSTLEANERTLGSATIRVRGKVDFEGQYAPLDLSNTYAGDFNVPVQVTVGTALPIAYALQNNLDSLRMKSIELEIDSTAGGKKQLAIDTAWTDKRVVRPGESLDITVLLTGDNGQEITRKLQYVVPVGAPTGPLFLTVADGPSTNAAEYRSLGVLQPKPAQELVSLLNGLRRNTAGYVRVWRQDAAYQVQGEDLPDPPPSIGYVLARGLAGQNVLPRSSRVAEMEFTADGAVIAGSKTIQLEVKE